MKNRVLQICITLLMLCDVQLLGNLYSSTQYAGIYDDINMKKYGGFATITVYPETDDTILFYIKLQKGPPSYNMGSLIGRARIDNGVATFILDEYDCRWSMTFTKSSLIIRTLQEKYDCGFGGGVIADGTYKRISSKIVHYFKDDNGKKVYFNELTHEE